MTAPRRKWGLRPGDLKAARSQQGWNAAGTDQVADAHDDNHLARAAQPLCQPIRPPAISVGDKPPQ